LLYLFFGFFDRLEDEMTGSENFNISDGKIRAAILNTHQVGAEYAKE